MRNMHEVYDAEEDYQNLIEDRDQLRKQLADLRREYEEAVALLSGTYAMLDELVQNESPMMTKIARFLDKREEG